MSEKSGTFSWGMVWHFFQKAAFKKQVNILALSAGGCEGHIVIVKVDFKKQSIIVKK
jgi:hypothetical protein